MRCAILILLVLVTTSNTAQAQLFWKGGIEIKHGIFGTSRIRAPAGTNICQSPCGLKMSGPYCGYNNCGQGGYNACGGHAGCGSHSACGSSCQQGLPCGQMMPYASAYASTPCGQGASAVIVPQQMPLQMRYSAPVFYAPARGGY